MMHPLDHDALDHDVTLYLDAPKPSLDHDVPLDHDAVLDHDASWTMMYTWTMMHLRP